MQEENSNITPEQSSDNTNTGNPVASNLESTVTAPKSKNLNLILTIVNAVLLIGLVVLYFIVLREDSGPDRAIMKASEGSVSVAYVNSDSILANYSLVKDMRAELEKNSAQLEIELKNKQTAYEKDAAYFQDQVNKRTISEASAQEIYGSLMAEQQKLYELREKYSADLAKQEFDMNTLLLDSLNNFLKRYNTKMNFDYIFSYARGGNILTANDSLDITNDVLRLLNDEYKENKAE